MLCVGGQRVCEYVQSVRTSVLVRVLLACTRTSCCYLLVAYLAMSCGVLHLAEAAVRAEGSAVPVQHLCSTRALCAVTL